VPAEKNVFGEVQNVGKRSEVCEMIMREPKLDVPRWTSTRAKTPINEKGG